MSDIKFLSLTVSTLNFKRKIKRRGKDKERGVMHRLMVIPGNFFVISNAYVFRNCRVINLSEKGGWGSSPQEILAEWVPPPPPPREILAEWVQNRAILDYFDKKLYLIESVFL